MPKRTQKKENGYALARILWLAIVLLNSGFAVGQCPEITNVNFNPPDGSFVCPGEPISITVEGENLPQGTIDWYIESTANSNNPNFNPYLGQGTYLGSSAIEPITDANVVDICDPCPELVAIMIDACNGNSGTGNEYDNEFLIISSGGGISSADQIQIDLDGSNNPEFGGEPGANNDINFGNDPCDFLDAPNPFIMAGLQASADCNNTNIIPAGPSTPIPAGALVLVLMSNNTVTNYNFNGLCANGETVYVLQSSCPRTIGAFSNSTSNGCRTYNVFIGDCSGCNSQITYNTSNASAESTSGLGGYAYVFDENGNGQIDFNGGCNSNEIIHVNGIPCEAPPVESIPIPPIPSTIEPFGFNAAYLECGEEERTFFIRGIINPLYENCLDNPFNPDYSPYLIGPYIYTVETQAPELLAPPQICVGQALDLDDLVVDAGQYTASGWLDNEDPFAASQAPDPFIPTATGNYDFYFFPISNGSTCYNYGCITIEVVDGLTPQLGTATVCQSETAYDLSQLEDPNFTDGTWSVEGGSAIIGGIFDASSYAGEVTLIFEPSDTGSGCASSTTPSTTITVTEGPMLDLSTSNNLGCVDDMATLSSGASGTGLTYLWDGLGIDMTNADQANPEVAVAGTYMVTVTDANDCFSIGSIELIQNTTDLPSVSAEANATITCDNSTIAIEGISANATQFDWTGPDGTTYTGAMPMVSDSGTYVLVVTTADGCTNSTSVQVQADTTAPTIGILLSNDLSCVTPEASLFGNSPQTNLINTFEWFLDGNPFSDEQNITTTEGGSYELIVTDLNGCTNADQVSVTMDTLSPDVSIAPVTETITCANPQIFLEGSSTTPMVSYTWDTPDGMLLGSNPPASSGGVYTLTVGAQNGCTATASITVNEEVTTPTIDLMPSLLNCSGSPASIATSSADMLTTYSWDGPNSYTSDSDTPDDIQEAGTYTVTITDVNGCTATASTTVISDNTVPTAEIQTPQGNNLDCNASTLLLEGMTEMGNTIEWILPDMTTSNEANQSVSADGIYTLTVTATNGCTNTASVQIDIDQTVPSLSLTQTTALNCENDGTLEIATDATSVIWTLPDMTTSTALAITASEAGLYSVEVTGSNGCTATDAIDVMTDSQQPTITDIASEDLTCTDNEAQLSASADIDNAVFEWMTPSGAMLSGAIQTVSETGNYILTVTNPDNGCSVTENAAVSTNEDLPTVTIDSSQGTNLDCNQPNVELIGSSTTDGVTFEWTTPTASNTNPTIDANAAGTYTLTVFNPANGCSNSTSIEINLDDSQPQIVQTGSGTIYCNPAFAEISVESDSASDTYEWLDMDNNPISSINTAMVTTGGDYTVVVTGSNGCTASTTVSVIEDNTPPSVTTQDIELDCDGTMMSLSASADDMVTYEWLDPDSNFFSDEASPSVTNTGTYTVVATSTTTGCTATASAVVTGSTDVPDVAIAISNDIDCDNNTATLTATTSVANPAFVWTNELGEIVASTASFEAGQAGNYMVEITDLDGGCTNTATDAVVGTNEVPDIAIAVSNAIDCTTTEATLTATTSISNVSYNWLDANGMTVSSNAIFMTSDTGTFTLEITNEDNGCTGSSTAVVMGSSEVPDVMITGTTNLDCTNTETTLTATTSIKNPSFSWTDEAGMTVSNTAELTTSEAGNYTVLITNLDSGCDASEQASVSTSSDTPDVDISLSNDIDCANSEATLTAMTTIANPSFEWTNSDGTILSTMATYTTSESGNYNLAITNDDNGCMDMAVVFVAESLDLPIVNVQSDNTVLDCDNGTATLVGSTDAQNPTIEWQNENGDVISNELEIMVTEPGIYTLIIEEGGCSDQAQLTVLQNAEVPSINITLTSTENIIDCNNTSVELTGSSADNVNYSWTGPDDFVATTPVIEAPQAGDYTLVIASLANDCTNTETYTVFDDFAPPSIDAQGGVLDCSGLGIALSASTAIPNSTFEWTGEGAFSSDEQNPIVTEAGIYNLTITSASNGCTATSAVEVVLDESFPELIASANPITCVDEVAFLDASLSTPAGDSIVYQWYWDNQPINNLEVDEAGTYQLIGTNINNQCADTLALEVVENTTPPTAIASEDATIDCIETTATLDASASTSTGGMLSYEWLNFNDDVIAQTAMIEVDSGGPYQVVITDTSNGCTASDTVDITEDNAEPLASILPFGMITCLDTSIELDASSPTGSSNLSYQWLDATGTVIGNAINQTVSEAGDYQVLVLNEENGCTQSQTATVIADIEAPALVIAEPDLLTCIVGEVILDASNSDSGTDFTIEWTAPSSMALSDIDILTPTATEAGIYSLSITNEENGCSAANTIEVLTNQTLPEAVASVEAEFGCSTDDVDLFGTGSSVGDQFDYLWSGPSITTADNLLNINVSQAGDYLLVVTDTENGCTNEASVNVPEGGNVINTSEVVVEDESCTGDANGIIQVGTVEGGTPPYLYAIDEGFLGPNNQFANLSPGTYPVLIQDAEGCEWQEEFTVQAATPLVVELGNNVIINLGETVDLNLQTVPNWETITWSDSTLTGESPSISPTNTTTINVSVTDENGCTETDAITIFIEKERPIYIPNAFSPNGDGTNDIFMIYGTEAVQNIKSFNVYDRWGELVYTETNFLPNDPRFGWDGFFRNKAFDPQVFVYYAEIEFTDGLVEVFKGDVSLIK